MINAVIIDDEPLLVKSIAFMLQKYCPNIKIVGTAGSAITGKTLIESQKPDLVFLDIQMPMGNGFDLLDSFDNIDFHVIIISAFDNYAIKAFKFDAVDYILKPIDIDELIVAVNKATDRIIQSKAAIKVNLKSLSSGSVDTENTIKISTSKGIIVMDIDDILYCQSNGNYTNIYLINGDKQLISKQLGEIEKLLSQNCFCRIHNEYIINTTKITNYTKGRGGYVTLINNIKLNVSAQKKNEFLAMYHPYKL